MGPAGTETGMWKKNERNSYLYGRKQRGPRPGWAVRSEATVGKDKRRRKQYGILRTERVTMPVEQGGRLGGEI